MVRVHVIGETTDVCDFLTVAGADAEGFKTTVHKRGVATFTDFEDNDKSYEALLPY